MDEDAELAALRRRAYGPHADIAGDPVALARLAELERRADGPTAGAPLVEIRRIGAIRTDVDESDPISPNRLIRPGDDERTGAAGPGGGVDAHPSGRPASPRHPQWHTAMVVAVAAVTLLVGGAAAAQTRPRPSVEASATPVPDVERAPAFAFAGDPASRILVHIPLDGSVQNLLDLPDPESGPRFPTDRALQWTRSLGDYYGWRLWIARDSGGDACMLITTGTDATARCETPDAQAEGALFLSVPYSEVEDAERPAGMRREQSIGFWWIPEGTVLVLTGRTMDAES